MGRRHDITNSQVDKKELEIIKLYAKQNNIAQEEAAQIYFHSKLMNILRDQESSLIWESPYYILERYSEYMVPKNRYLKTNCDRSVWERGMKSIPKLEWTSVIDDSKKNAEYNTV